MIRSLQWGVLASVGSCTAKYANCANSSRVEPVPALDLDAAGTEQNVANVIIFVGGGRKKHKHCTALSHHVAVVVSLEIHWQ